MSILVTGGSSGIGRAIAERFAKPGVEVFINYRSSDDAARATAAALLKDGASPHLVRGDMGIPDEVRAVVAEVGEHVTTLDQIVHCAASTHSGPLLDASHDTLLEVLSVNALSLVTLVREALPLLKRGSSVIYLSSPGARSVLPGYGALGIAKALGEHIVRHLAVEVAPAGIRVNTLAVGPVDTAAFRAMFPDNADARLAAAAAKNPSGRGLTARDAAEVAWEISRPQLEMLQGQTVTVDGGITL
jgi:NAD(P)-dependent dehydrogenase (short-subunit alcohol dehydrogenase family)